LVEDDASVARAIARTMSKLHARAIIVSTVDAARAQLNDPELSLAGTLADICLGPHRFGGVDVLEHALLVRPDMCTLAMTALERSRELDDRLAALDIPLAPKPVDAHVLATFIHRATAKHGVDRARRLEMIDSIGDSPEVPLTDAERDTCFHLSYGLTPLEIAAAMGVDESTVRSHLDATRRKLRVHSVNALYGLFIREFLRTS
jgi:DNA-binding CsgD family transcriptional regulator